MWCWLLSLSLNEFSSWTPSSEVVLSPKAKSWMLILMSVPVAALVFPIFPLFPGFSNVAGWCVLEQNARNLHAWWNIRSLLLRLRHGCYIYSTFSDRKRAYMSEPDRTISLAANFAIKTNTLLRPSTYLRLWITFFCTKGCPSCPAEWCACYPGWKEYF